MDCLTYDDAMSLFFIQRDHDARGWNAKTADLNKRNKTARLKQVRGNFPRLCWRVVLTLSSKNKPGRHVGLINNPLYSLRVLFVNKDLPFSIAYS